MSMKAKDIYKKGQKVKVDIRAVNGHGEGIGHLKYEDEDFIIFVPNCRKGETVTVEITHVYDNYLTGRKIK